MSKFSEYKDSLFDNSYDYPCPVCGSDLKRAKRTIVVFDGNSVFECVSNKSHRFWKNARERGGHLHLNPDARETNFNSKEDYVWNEKEKKWEIEK